MKTIGLISTVVFTCLLLGGCAADSGTKSASSGQDTAPKAGAAVKPGPTALSAAGGDAVVARVGTLNITSTQLLKPLIEAHGLSMLQNLLQLEMARQTAAAAQVVISPAEIAAEEARTLDLMFADQKVEKEQYPMLLAQFLERKNMSPVEWKMLMESNAILRKLSEPLAVKAIQDQMLHEAYNQLYGEKVQVRHIQCTNLSEIAEARRRIAEGEKFDAVARTLSRNARTAPLGGELAPFTRQSPYPQAFKDAAFALKNPGDLSDPVQAEGSYHLIFLEQRIAPKVIKFEDVKDSLKEELVEKLVQQIMQERRLELSERARRTLQILEPTLKAQYEAETQRRSDQLRDRDQIRREIERERDRSGVATNPLPATRPTTRP